MRALLIAVLLIGAVAVVGLAVYQSEEPPPQPGDGIDLVRADYAGIDRAVAEQKG